jgi:hypothetical protein
MTNPTRWVGIDLHRRRSQISIMDGPAEPGVFAVA